MAARTSTTEVPPMTVPSVPSRFAGSSSMPRQDVRTGVDELVRDRVRALPTSGRSSWAMWFFASLGNVSRPARPPPIGDQGSGR